jgi:DNA-directed RNA polymerase subunit RPC12/RpoP
MSRNEIELNCECARCGKAVYHTVRWLRENTAVQCVSCNNSVPSIEILRDNTKLVRESDDAEHRNADS